MPCDWKINTLSSRVTNGELDQNRKIFMSALARVIKQGKRPTYKTMANRRPVMRNWRKRDSAEVIEILAKRGDIVIDESKQPTAYYLPKKVKK
jgi:predicted transcriptional regulator